MLNHPRWRSLAIFLCLLAFSLPLSPGTTAAGTDDGVAQYEALYRQFRNLEISSEEFARRKAELAEQYGLTFTALGRPIPAKTGGRANNIIYIVSFGLRSEPAMAVLGALDSEAECNSMVEAQVLQPQRLKLSNLSRSWFADADTIVDWEVDRDGNGHWQITVYRCGPDIPGPLEPIYQQMKLDFPEVVDRVTQQIRARGFDPG